MVKRNKLLDKDFEHVGHALQQSPGADTVRAETALEISAYLTLVKDVEQGKYRIDQQQADTDKHAFERCRKPRRHHAVEQLVEPCRETMEIIYRVVIHNLI